MNRLRDKFLVSMDAARHYFSGRSKFVTRKEWYVDPIMAWVASLFQPWKCRCCGINYPSHKMQCPYRHDPDSGYRKLWIIGPGERMYWMVFFACVISLMICCAIGFVSGLAWADMRCPQ